MNNLELYNAAREVPDEAKKTIAAGRLKGFTDVNPMWRIKKLTELFGHCGIGWWYTIEKRWTDKNEATGEVCAFCEINLYYKYDDQVSEAVVGTGGSSFVAAEKNGLRTSDECFKMALTDAISVAAKAIGVAADVYYSKDRTKYTADTATPIDETPAFDEYCEDCGAVIMPYLDAKGRSVSVPRLAARSRERFGRVLCSACAERAAASENGD